MMPQSMSQGRSQSAHSPELQQQQQMQESSEVQEPQVAQSSTMLQRVRNSQKRQERMQWTQQSASMPGHQFCCLGHAQTPKETDFGGYEMTWSAPTLGKSKRCRRRRVPGGEQG